MKLRNWIPFLAVFAVSALFASAASAAFSTEPGTRLVTFKTGTPVSQQRAAVEKAGGEVLKEVPLVDGLLVSFKGARLNAAVLLKAEPEVEFVEPNRYRKWIEGAWAPSVPTALMRARSLMPETPRALPAAVRTAAAEEPEQRSEIPWGVARVKAPAAWEKTTGAGIRVAVVDTGVDYEHPDLKDNYAGGYNAIDPEGDPMDGHGHGTHVAGTIAGVHNDMGVIGVAPHAKIYGIKVLDENGGGSLYTIIAGLDWAVQNEMQVVNMSLGGPHSDIMYKAIRKAYDAGLTLVAATGNDPEASVSAPARYAETIGVSASTSEDALAGFSTVGDEVDFIAPGHEILSAWPQMRLARLSGTSMACPHVAGLAALAAQLGYQGTDQVRSFLAASAVAIEGLTAVQQGNGMVEADKF